RERGNTSMPESNVRKEKIVDRFPCGKDKECQVSLGEFNGNPYVYICLVNQFKSGGSRGNRGFELPFPPHTVPWLRRGLKRAHRRWSAREDDARDDLPEASAPSQVQTFAPGEKRKDGDGKSYPARGKKVTSKSSESGNSSCAVQSVRTSRATTTTLT